MPALTVSRRVRASRLPPPLRPLRVNDLLFLNAYLQNGRNATQAYRAVHPRVSVKVADVLGCRRLARVNVQAELQRRVGAEGGVTRAFVESTLLDALALARADSDADAMATIAMDCAKLAGFLVEKRQDVTQQLTQLPAADLEAALDLRLRQLREGPPTTSPRVSHILDSVACSAATQ